MPSTGVTWYDELEPYFPVPRTAAEAAGPKAPEYRTPAVGGYTAHPALPPHPDVVAIEALKQFLGGRQGFVWTEDMSEAERAKMLTEGPAALEAYRRGAQTGSLTSLLSRGQFSPSADKSLGVLSAILNVLTLLPAVPMSRGAATKMMPK